MISIKYITNVRIPTPRAQGFAIMKVCEEFANRDVNVDLIIPKRKESSEDPFKYYGIKNNFNIIKSHCFDLLGKTFKFGKIFYWMDILSFLVLLKLSGKIAKNNVIYSRDFVTALFFSKNKLFLELHDIPKSKFFFLKALRISQAIFVLNQNIKNKIIEIGIDQNKIFISPSGVDLKEFDIKLSQKEAREKLKLPVEKKIVLYTGHFYPWKGVDTIARVAVSMPDTLFIFVGGIGKELEDYSKKYNKYKNIIFNGFIPRHNIPAYLKSADVLVAPYSSHENIASFYTSPLKIFEYMASRRPIVASDLSSLRQVLNEKNSVFAKPDDTESFSLSIEKILGDNSLYEKISNQAFLDVSNYTWKKKVEDILNNIK